MLKNRMPTSIGNAMDEPEAREDVFCSGCVSGAASQASLAARSDKWHCTCGDLRPVLCCLIETSVQPHFTQDLVCLLSVYSISRYSVLPSINASRTPAHGMNGLASALTYWTWKLQYAVSPSNCLLILNGIYPL